MTKINRIVMQGFKSFAKRTELVFSDHYNTILGPNGSGKSNVLDALCFVLGKSSAKGLRAEKSSNLIYNGGKTKKPAKEGEVSIYFDNAKKEFPTAEPEVKISRIITQTGQSRYKINDKLRTRQQIIDLLAAARTDPEGYNIILQGDITRLIEMSTTDRRLMIEEIAGIGVYEDKKQKALKELEKVDGKLGEAEIILKERKAYLKELKAERDQALKYKEINDRIIQNKASYVKIQIDKKEEEKTKTQKLHDEHKSTLEKKQGKIKGSKDLIERHKEEVEAIRKEVEEKGEAEQVALQREIEQLRVDSATSKTRIGSIENEITRIGQRKEQLAKNLEEIKVKLAEFKGQKESLENERQKIGTELQTIADKIKTFKEKHHIEQDTISIDQQIERLDHESDELQREVQRLREGQQELLRKKDRIEFQIQTIDSQIEKVGEIEREHHKEVEELKLKRKLFSTTMEELNSALTQSTKNARDGKELEGQIFVLREQLEKLALQQTRVVERKTGSLAVKKILEEKKQFGQVYGTVAELGEVKSKYSLALEVAAGARVNNIVVETDEIAARCIKYLKTYKLGTATFLPLNKLKAPPQDANAMSKKSENGVHGLALELVRFEPKFQKVFAYVFGNTLVVEDIETARRIGIGNARMATLTGDLADISGAMQGGFRSQKSAFHEEDATQDIERVSFKINGLQKERDSLRQSNEELDDKILRLRQEKANLEGEIIKTEKGLHLKPDDLDASKKYKEELEKEIGTVTKEINIAGVAISENNKKLTEQKIERQKLREQMMQRRSPTVLAELAAFEQKHRELNNRTSEIVNELKVIAMQSQDILERDKENTTKIIKDIEKEHAIFKREIGELAEKLKWLLKTLREKEEQQAKQSVKFRDLYLKRNKLNEEISKLDKLVEEILEKSREDEFEMNTQSLELARIKAELVGLSEEFAQYEGITLDLQKPEAEIKREIKEFEKMKETIGSVNMRALDIYEAVEKEFNNLVEKKEKLLCEKEDVVDLMNEIETKKIDLFMKNFENINEQFKVIFVQLSSKGEAYLELENPEKPFEAGVQIKVKLTGTKFMDIRSLSGGEKTMTALAFIFAIQEYEPASFYILDEVDAALDKHNSEKFAKLIRKYAEKAQYIIISHNDSVISEADSLYGVSMNEHGMSTVVSLRI